MKTRTKTHILLAISGLALARAPGHAQTNGPLPTIWQAAYGGGASTSGSWPIDFAETIDGGFLICGVSDATTNEFRTAPICADDDAWVIKIDAQGQRLWDRSYGGWDQDWPVRLFVTPDGGFIVGGSSYSGGGCQKTAPHRAYAVDLWLVRCDALGNLLWDETYAPQTSLNLFTGMVPTADGGYVLCGGLAPYNPNLIDLDLGLVNVDGQGRTLWTRLVGSAAGYEFPMGVFETPGGGFIVFGNSEGVPPSRDKTSPYYGGWQYDTWGYGSDSWVVRLDSQRNKLWDKSYGGPGVDQPRHVSATADGGFLMVGPSSSPPQNDPRKGTKTSPLYGGFDYWAVRIDAQGNQLWEASYGGSANDICDWAEPMPDGGWLLAGESSSAPSGNKRSPRFGATDLWLVRIDDHGNKMWDQTFGGWGTEGNGSATTRGGAYTVTRVKRTTVGNFLLVGRSASVPSGNKTAPKIGTSDYWVLKLGPEPPSLRGEMTAEGLSTDLSKLRFPRQEEAQVHFRR